MAPVRVTLSAGHQMIEELLLKNRDPLSYFELINAIVTTKAATPQEERILRVALNDLVCWLTCSLGNLLMSSIRLIASSSRLS